QADVRVGVHADLVDWNSGERQPVAPVQSVADESIHPAGDTQGPGRRVELDRPPGGMATPGRPSLAEELLYLREGERGVPDGGRDLAASLLAPSAAVRPIWGRVHRERDRGAARAMLVPTRGAGRE